MVTGPPDIPWPSEKFVELIFLIPSHPMTDPRMHISLSHYKTLFRTARTRGLQLNSCESLVPNIVHEFKSNMAQVKCFALLLVSGIMNYCFKLLPPYF